MGHGFTLYRSSSLGGFIGGLVVWLAYLPHWNITEDKGAI